MNGSTTAMRVPLKTEFALAEAAPRQQNPGGGNYYQRHQLLPIHGGNITPNRGDATKQWVSHSDVSCYAPGKMCKPTGWRLLRLTGVRAGGAGGCASKRTVVEWTEARSVGANTVATKDHKRMARGLIEALECRVHAGPPVHEAEVRSAREFLCQNDFPLASDYFQRLEQIRSRLEVRATAPPPLLPGKRNYGGEAAGRWMQLQSAYDHVILSTCYEGDFDCKHGRVKISHRFNRAGRVDFVELKYLRSLHCCLDGEIRKLLRITDYQTIRRDWHTAEAFVLAVLPQELVFLYQDIFRCPRPEVLTWLVNIGHRMAGDLLEHVRACPVNGSVPHRGVNGDQLGLEAIRGDEVAVPILGHAASLESAVDLSTPKTAWVRYSSRR